MNRSRKICARAGASASECMCETETKFGMAVGILLVTVVNLLMIGYLLTTIGHANATGNWDTDDDPGTCVHLFIASIITNWFSVLITYNQQYT